MRFTLKMRAQTRGGEVDFSDSLLSVCGADEAVLILSAATSFNGFDKDPQTEGKDEILWADTYDKKASTYVYTELKKRHVEDYQSYFNRVQFELEDRTDHSDKDIKERLFAYREGAHDPALEALYYQFGRYLLISSSRPGGMPANLQGIWNHLLRAPWSSNYTMNINAEMDYWLAEVCNLSEMHIPPFWTMFSECRRMENRPPPISIVPGVGPLVTIRISGRKQILSVTADWEIPPGLTGIWEVPGRASICSNITVLQAISVS